MKQKWLSVSAALLLTAVLAGCTASQPQNPNQDQNQNDQQALSGFNAENTNPSPNAGTPATPDNSNTAGLIDEARAKEIALNHAGVKADDATFVKCKLDHDDGRQEYELEWYASGTKYEYDINAADGTVLNASYESTMMNGTTGQNANAAVSEDAARQTALSKVSGATVSDIYEWKFDYDDGQAEYEGKIIYGGMEYEFTIDATTGNIIEWDTERLGV